MVRFLEWASSNNGRTIDRVLTSLVTCAAIWFNHKNFHPGKQEGLHSGDWRHNLGDFLPVPLYDRSENETRLPQKERFVCIFKRTNIDENLFTNAVLMKEYLLKGVVEAAAPKSFTECKKEK